jgi:hypothetical protein
MTVDNVARRTTAVTLPWRKVGLVLLAVPSIILSGVLIALLFLDGEPFDWWTFSEAASRFGTGTLYDWGQPSPGGEPYGYRYGPLYAALMAPFSVLGLGVWRLLHVAVLAFLPWRIALVVLIFPPFWYDVLHGNVVTFVFVAGWLALNGSRWGTLAYFALLVMVPRPLMLPVAAWIVWQRPEWRLPAMGFALVGLAQLAYPGFLPALLRSGGVESIDNLGPSALIGWAWVPIGLALGAWLTWKGRLGLAALAVSPYVLPYYLVIGLLELSPLVARAVHVADEDELEHGAIIRPAPSG